MNPKDTTRLWEELRHRDPDEKSEWIRQLAEQPSPGSVDVLLDVLKQESWYLRDQAARALATMGEPVVDRLIDMLEVGLWYTRSAAASALGRMGLPVAAAPLVALLRDPNRTVRDSARDALVQICGNEVGAFAVASAVHELAERAQRFAIDGLASREPSAAERILAILADPGARAAAERRPTVRAVNEDGVHWDAVVGEEEAKQGTA
jgi:HEAT repeat protein